MSILVCYMCDNNNTAQRGMNNNIMNNNDNETDHK